MLVLQVAGGIILAILAIIWLILGFKGWCELTDRGAGFKETLGFMLKLTSIPVILTAVIGCGVFMVSGLFSLINR